MLVANGLANFIGAVLVNALLSKVEGYLLPISIASAHQTFHIVFTTTAFSFAIIFTVLYERPIRQYLNALSKNAAMPGEFVSKARRRLLNEPFVLLALDLGIWLTAAIVYSAFHWILGAGPLEIQSTISDALANGLVTVTLAFFLLEHVLQKILAPYVFPEGGLYKIPKNLTYSDPHASCCPYGSMLSYTASFNTSYHAPNSSYSARRHSSTGTTTISYISLRICFLKSKFLFDGSGESKFNQAI